MRLIVNILLILVCSPLMVHSKPIDSEFAIFDALVYRNKPSLQEYGLKPIKVIYTGELWGSGEDKSKPNFERIVRSANAAKGHTLVCLDIEHWPVSGDRVTVRESVDKYKAVANAFKKVNFLSEVGFYGVLPIRDYWRAIRSEGESGRSGWIEENAALVPIVESIDVVFPSLYTFYPSIELWEKFAVANLKEAKKYGKPVYAFLWPMYHDSTVLKGQYIPRDFWRVQLETCLKYADGIVLWGGVKEKWEPSADWWVETKDFLDKLKSNSIDVPKEFSF